MRRRLAIVVAALAAIAAGCGLASRGDDGGSRSHASAVPTRPAPAPLQFANGPVEAADPGQSPLRLKLRGGATPVRVRFHQPAAQRRCSSTSTRARSSGGACPTACCRSPRLTKMMTALVVVQRERPADKVRVTKEALAYKGSGVGVLPKGKRVKLETMLNGLLLPSGNDAAIALAQRVERDRRPVRRCA